MFLGDIYENINVCDFQNDNSTEMDIVIIYSRVGYSDI